jgi:hypothetical protein
LPPSIATVRNTSSCESTSSRLRGVDLVWRERKNQQDATIRCLLSTSVSTCFGHDYAHLQESKARVLLHTVYCAGSARNMLRQKLIINIWLLHLDGFFSLSLHTLLTMQGHRNLKPKIFTYFAIGRSFPRQYSSAIVLYSFFHLARNTDGLLR